jgi:prepilin-type N-terminal cleavage/methylation domain-containing protein
MRRARHNPGFTMMELLMSLLVIGLLMSLLITAAVHVRRVARATVDRQAVRNIAQGVSQFTRDFGFAPPLIRDQDTTANPSRVAVAGAGSVPARLNVYTPITSAAHEAALRAPSAGYSAANPLADNRFSTVSLAAYLVGGVPTARGGGASVPADLPIDGVRGPGMYKPRRDGSFEVPPDALTNAVGATKRTGGRIEPLVDLSKSGVQLVTPAGLPANLQGAVELRDARGGVIRYYAWIQGDPSNNGAVTDFASMNIPPVVGRWTPDAQNPDSRAELARFKLPEDRNVASNARLRTASWAVVAPGPDGLFGDEPDAAIAAYYGNAANQFDNRVKAEADNIVEVGP